MERQTELLPLLAGTHTATYTQVNATFKAQKQFEEYLDSMRNILGLAAEMFGVVYEIRDCMKNVKLVKDELLQFPEGAIATALSTRRSYILNDMYTECIAIGKDIKAAIDPKKKMTEMDRIKILANIRPKLRMFNKALKKFSFFIHNTRMITLWEEVVGRAGYSGPDRIAILKGCIRRWKINLKGIHHAAVN